MTKINLQMFADGDNNNQTARSFSLQFKELLAAVLSTVCRTTRMHFTLRHPTCLLF